MSRLLKWERLALKGDFSAMPKPFRWEESGRLAHFINVHEVPGGFDASPGWRSACLPRRVRPGNGKAVLGTFGSVCFRASRAAARKPGLQWHADA